MNKVTRNALERVTQILDNAGWMPASEFAQAEPSNLSEESLMQMRGSYDRLLRRDYFEILQNTLEKRLPIADAGRIMGLDAQAARRLFFEAINHLSQFVDECQHQ